jgi:cobalt-zinc-cadmium efflux system membrane fusion protein
MRLMLFAGLTLVFCGFLRPAAALPPAGPSDAASAGQVTMPAAEAERAGIVVAPAVATPTGKTLRVMGRITYDDLRVAHVYTPVTGRVQRVLAQPGQSVRQGQALACIDSPDMGAAQADWDKAHAELETATRELARQEFLFGRHATSGREVEAARDIHHRAITEQERARNKLVLLGGRPGAADDDIYRLQAPLAGVVVSRNVNPGMEVAGQYAGGPSPELFVVADLSRVWATAELYEADVGRIARGAQVAVHVDALPQLRLEGTLDWVADVLDPALHTLKVRCTVPNPDGHLKPDMFVHLDIAVPGTLRLTVPSAALVHLGRDTFVFVEQRPSPEGSRRFVRRHVVVDEGGPAQGEAALVLYGLNAGEPVVVGGVQAISAVLE